MKKQQTNNTLFPVVLVIGVLVLLGIGLAFVGGSKKGGTVSDSEYSAGALTVSHATFDFGTISMKDGNVSHGFELKNEGGEPVTIGKVSTSCMCTTAFLIDGSGKKYGGFGMPGHGTVSRADVKVGPGETVILEAVFDPNAHGPSGVGLAQRSVYLETNSSKSPKLELSFNATVTQ